jgi:threonine dehydratase
MIAPVGPALVSLEAIQIAAERLHGAALITPLLPFADPSRRAGTPSILLKPESLQEIGSFKIRGAYNAIASLPDERRAIGVVSHSSGNHGQGVARAARQFGIRAVIVMPSDAAAIKLSRVRADGAEVILVGSSSEERAERAALLAREHGLALIPSYDDAAIIAGQGTVGLEIVEQIVGRPDQAGSDEPTQGAGLLVLVPVGGGGLASGVATAVKTRLPQASVVGVEPELAADARESLAAGRLVRWEPELVGATIADGMRATSLGELPFAHLRRYLDGVVAVSESEIARAMARAADVARLVLEPSGATALAAWLFHAQELPAADTVVCVLSGGNVDPDRYVELTSWGRREGG